MREVAGQVRGTTEEQARGSGRIRESIEQGRDAAEIPLVHDQPGAPCRRVEIEAADAAEAAAAAAVAPAAPVPP